MKVVFKALLVLLLITSIFIYYDNYIKVDNGVDENNIILGQSSAISGAASDLGISFRDGALSYFEYINSMGGVNGRKIKLITYDDKYEPSLAVENSLKLITEDKVFALFGEVGTPTSKAVLKIVNEYKVPFLTPFSGAELLRKPFNPLVVNFRASYYGETEEIVKYLVDKLKMKNIAIFYQSDSYGKDGLRGVKIALNKRNIELSASGAYIRNTLSITTALNSIKKVNPQAVIMIGAYKPCAEFIKRAKKEGLTKTIFANISFVGSRSLLNELEGKTDNLIISQVVPLPCIETNEAVSEYKKIFLKSNPKNVCGFVSFEGFLSAKLIVEALRQSREPLSRKSFISSFERLSNNSLKGIEIELSKNDHQAMNDIYLTIYKDGELLTIDGEK